MWKMTPEEYMLSYIEARRARVARDRQGRVERAGFHLLASARGTDDGQPDLREAIVGALKSGDVEAALEIGGNLLGLPDAAFPAVRGNGNFSASGEIRRVR